MARPAPFYADIPLADGTLHCRISQRLQENHSIWNEPRHRNSEYELHIVMKGAAELHFDDDAAAVLPQGHAILIAPNVFHQVRQLQEGSERFFVQCIAEGPRLTRLLQTTDDSVSQIASAVGYSSESSFRKVFRAQYQATPQEMRKRLRNTPGK